MRTLLSLIEGIQCVSIELLSPIQKEVNGIPYMHRRKPKYKKGCTMSDKVKVDEFIGIDLADLGPDDDSDLWSLSFDEMDLLATKVLGSLYSIFIGQVESGTGMRYSEVLSKGLRENATVRLVRLVTEMLLYSPKAFNTEDRVEYINAFLNGIHNLNQYDEDEQPLW